MLPSQRRRGEPVRIMDHARQMIRLASLRPNKDFEIVVTDPRPGENLREELFTKPSHWSRRAIPGLA